MALIISDPTTLITGGDAGTDFVAQIVLDTGVSPMTIQIIPGAGILPDSADGITGQALYSALKLIWKNSSTYIKLPFPMESITPEQFEIKQGWALKDLTTRKALRTCGWAERDLSNNVIAQWAGIISLGNLGATDQPYYQQVDSVEPSVNFTFPGAINEAIQVVDDPNGDGNFVDGFDNRTYLKLFAREEQKTYSAATLTDIGVTNMTYIVYRFPLANSSDTIKVLHTDADITGAQAATYSGITIEYFGVAQSRSIGTNSYNFDIIIDGNGKTAEEIYTKIQYLLRQNSDIDAGAGSVIGKTADSLLRFVGDNLYTSQGVFIDNFAADDTNRLYFYDTGNTERIFPFVSTGVIRFNDNLVNDASSVYRMYFTTADGGNNYGTVNAILVQDNSGTPVSGLVSAQSEISYTYNYDFNNQRGGGVWNEPTTVGTAGTNAAITVVAIGLSTGQYVVSPGTIERSKTNAVSLVAALERVYFNA